eukprot:CAMPEP_0177589798 /NCGR_PEP_ID=MMETSP0419_2-20121207/7023_1 /TAXON_ID=582737 /ORGANISM="Tetraselmis sp., Strain GSL018" /LENGTH=401 /DNA_ID=CAMNT_0019080231 /DNA_START=123 /DNA_END=1328 /DNA_ORIENTATION=+
MDISLFSLFVSYLAAGNAYSFSTSELCAVYRKLPGRVENAHIPGFIIVGAQKAGTTYLHNFLSKVPGLAAPDNQPAKKFGSLPPIYENITKELHFFDRANLGDESFQKEYLSAWSEANPQEVLFESTPGYLPTPLAPYRISQLLPQVKVVIVLREPVSRALSHWNMRQTFCQRKIGRVKCPPSFDVAVNKEMKLLNNYGCNFQTLAQDSDAWNKCFRCFFEASCDFTEGVETKEWFNSSVNETGPREECKRWSSTAGYVFRGLYAPQISWWLHFFKPSQMYIINQDDLAGDPVRLLNDLLMFLNIKASTSSIQEILSKQSEAFLGGYTRNHLLSKEKRQIFHAVQRLKIFYALHNANLYRLLREMGISNFSHFNFSKTQRQVNLITGSVSAADNTYRTSSS